MYINLITFINRIIDTLITKNALPLTEVTNKRHETVRQKDTVYMYKQNKYNNRYLAYYKETVT